MLALAALAQGMGVHLSTADVGSLCAKTLIGCFLDDVDVCRTAIRDFHKARICQYKAGPPGHHGECWCGVCSSERKHPLSQVTGAKFGTDPNDP